MFDENDFDETDEESSEWDSEWYDEREPEDDEWDGIPPGASRWECEQAEDF